MLELHQGPELLQSIAILSLKPQDPKQQVCNNIFCSTRILLYKINKLVGLANPNYCPVVQRGFPELLDIHLYFFIGIFGFLITFFFSWFDYRRRRASITISLSHVTWGGWGRWKQVQIWRYEVAISTPEIKRGGWYQSVSLKKKNYPVSLAKIRKKIQFSDAECFSLILGWVVEAATNSN